MEREDNRLIALDGITTEETNYFQVYEGLESSRLFAGTSKNTRLQLFFTVNNDVTVISRTVYSTFMLLGDVGGFTGLLYYVGSFLVSLLTYNNPQNGLVQKLFVVSKEKQGQRQFEELDSS